MSTGYSNRSLVDKLGIKENFKVLILNPPKHYPQLLGPLPSGVVLLRELAPALDFIQLFTKESDELEQQFPILKTALALKGMLWVSWPKLASKIPTDLNENLIREIGLSNKLVDVKVCAIDQNWSGLKFVYRLKDRK